MQFTTILELEAYGSMAAPIPGDASGNGFVDGGDLNVLLANWNKTGASWSDGDFTGNGYIDGGDLNILLSNWNAGIDPAKSAATAASPATGITANAKTSSTAAAFTAQINFQPASVVAPKGCLIDSGLPFGRNANGYTYGWTKDLSAFAVQRNIAASPDARYDTAVMLTSGGTWEMAVPNGMYDVKIFAGTGDSGSLSAQKFSIEGVPTAQTQAPAKTAGSWFEEGVTVVVTDGRLTITANPGSSICFVQITGR
jgi:hypothetical protein